MERQNKIVQQITQCVANVFSFYVTIAIEHSFSMLKHSHVPRKVKISASGLGFQHVGT